MTAHDAQTLIAMRHRLRELEAVGGEGRMYDISVAALGQRLFGEGWTPVKHGRYDYAPLVSMSFGRLAKMGLCRRAQRRSATSSSKAKVKFHAWVLTDEGRHVADEMLVLAGSAT